MIIPTGPMAYCHRARITVDLPQQQKDDLQGYLSIRPRELDRYTFISDPNSGRLAKRYVLRYITVLYCPRSSGPTIIGES